jgi:site-specific recombinase XerC
MRDYRKSLDLEILPTFASAPLHAIDALAVEEWLAALARRGLGVKRWAKARAVLSMVLDSAVKGGKLARHVVADVAAPKGQRRELPMLAGRLDATRGAALRGVKPHRSPTVVPLSKAAGQTQ